MTKRSAIMMAAGLAVALLVGIAAISLTMSGTSAAHAGRHRKPIVHHRVQTVTIHKKSPSTEGPQPVQIVHLGPTSSGATTSTAAAPGTFSEPETGTDDVGSDDGAGGHGGSPGTGGAYGDD
jgi:hypothetical protein